MNDYVIVTFDEDFEQLETLYGFPPKVILFRFGNAPTKVLETIIRTHFEAIERFANDTSSGLLEIF